MEKVAGGQRLFRRNGVYYYRRRVPLSLVDKLGRTFVQLSLNTTSSKQSRKLRAIKDLEWDAQFEDAEKIAASGLSTGHPGAGPKSPPPSERDLVQLVRDYVERMDKRFASHPPETEEQRKELWMEAQIQSQFLRKLEDRRADQEIYLAGKDILEAAGQDIDDPALPHSAFAELVRRGLLELEKRSLARLTDNHRHAFFDQLFNPSRPPEVSFGELAEQQTQLAAEDAATNRMSQKWVDKQRANLALIREIIGDSTPVDAIDYDTCLHVRSTLARIPANRTKIYGSLPLDQAMSWPPLRTRPCSRQ
jgi:hypothetical protein